MVTVRPLANHDGDGDSNENTTKQNISREKALRMRLTICTSQRPRQNINIYSHPNLRGLRTGKPTTSCLCFCFKLNRVRTGQIKDFTSRKSRAKAPHFVHLLHTILQSPTFVLSDNSTPLTHVTYVMLKSRSGVVRDCRNLQPFAKLSR